MTKLVNPCVFLFNVGHPEISNSYGTDCFNQLFKPLLLQSSQSDLETVILSGDIILTSFCEVMTEFEKIPKKHSLTLSSDKKRFLQIMWELVDCMSPTFSSSDTNELTKSLLQGSVYAVCFSCMDKFFAKKIDKELKRFAPYLGSSFVEVGNPLLKIVFLEQLIKSTFISKNKIYVDENSGISHDFRMILRNTSTYEIVEFSEGVNLIPEITYPKYITERGKKSLSIIKKQCWKSHHNKITEAFYKYKLEEQNGTSFSSKLPKGFEEIEIPGSKLEGYALNFEHLDGKNKAQVFKSKLGLVKEDSEYIALQIRYNLHKADIEKISVSEYGVKYSARIDIEGKNNTTATIRTAWIVNSEQPARLTTLFVDNERDQKHSEINNQSSSLYISGELPENERWKCIMELAHKHGNDSFSREVAYPMTVGNVLYREGKCGYAVVVLPDSRKKFAKWVITTNQGSRSRPGVSLNLGPDSASQSYEQNYAYAKAAAYVFELNGIQCKVHDWID